MQVRKVSGTSYHAAVQCQMPIIIEWRRKLAAKSRSKLYKNTQTRDENGQNSISDNNKELVRRTLEDGKAGISVQINARRERARS